MSNQFGSLKSRALMTSSAAVLGFVLAGSLGSAAMAQDASAAPPQQIVVTGSRIVRRDFTSNSPIVTLNSKAFENTSNVAVEATLNKLPQFSPDQNLMGATGGTGNSNDYQPNTNHTVGISTASLRGLGANRTLTLVDGHRLTPVNGLMEVDLNSIPSSAIDHVETITGGASAVYGPDAVGGVVNFILKKNFQGFTVDTQYGETGLGDDQEFKVSAIMGTNFADDRGNVTLGVERYSRSIAWQNNRDAFTKGWADPYADNNFFGFINGIYLNGGSGINPAGPGWTTNNQYANTLGWTIEPGGQGNINGTPPSVVLGADGVHTWPWAFQIGPTRPGVTGGEVASFLAGGGVIDGQSVAYQYNYDYFTAYGATGPQDPNTPPPLVKVLKFNQVDQYLLSPQDRWSAYGNGHYNITDSLEVDMGFNFANTKTATHHFPPSLVPGYDFVVPYDGVNGAGATKQNIVNGVIVNTPSPHPIPAAFAQVLNLRSDPTAPYTIEMLPGYNQDNSFGWVPQRTSADEAWTYQLYAELKGKILPSDWTWNLYAAWGEASENIAQNAYLDVARWRAVLGQPNWGKGAVLQGNFWADPYNTNFPASTTLGNVGKTNNAGIAAPVVTCTSGFYDALFKGGTPSADCIRAVTVDLLAQSQVRQYDVEFDTQGTVVDLPAGPLQVSLGSSYRSDSLYYRPSEENQTNSFITQPLGAYSAAFTRGAVYIAEGYGEALVPVLKDLPFVKHFNLELGARYSTYSTSPGGWTYKALADWGLTDWARLRGGYNLAVRAPSVGELFEGYQQKYQFSPKNPGGDPCSLQSSAPYGAGHANDAQLAATPSGATTSTLYNTNGQQGAKNTLAICLAQMGASVADINAAINNAGPFDAPAPSAPINLSDDTGAYTFYNTGQPNPGSGSPGFPYQGGNTKLQPEIAKTWTAGVILNSPFHDPWLSRAAFSVDWYSIIVDHTIDFGTLSGSASNCYTQNVLDGSGTNVDANALNAALYNPDCIINQRNASVGGGNWVSGAAVYTNLGYLNTRGFDMTATWSADFADIGLSAIPGSLSLNMLGNYLDTWQTRADVSNPAEPLYDYAGTYYSYATFRWKLNTTLTYSVGPVSVSLNWRHLPEAKSDRQRRYFTQLAYYNAGKIGTVPAYLDTGAANNWGINYLPAASHDEFDLSTTWSITDRITLRGGVNNLFGAQPETTNANTGGFDPVRNFWDLPKSGLGVPDTGSYDVLGRRFYFGLNAKF